MCHLRPSGGAREGTSLKSQENIVVFHPLKSIHGVKRFQKPQQLEINFTVTQKKR